jgi:hypothetical protein
MFEMLDKMYKDNKEVYNIPVEEPKICKEKYTEIKDYKRQYYLKNFELYQERNKNYRLMKKKHKLIDSYLESNFKVNSCNEFIKIGVKHNLYKNCLFITAYNPFSNILSYDDNNKRHLKMIKTFEDDNYKFIEGIGEHPSNSWIGEKSLLVYDIDLETSKRYGNKFEQNAIIWINENHIPELIIL